MTTICKFYNGVNNKYICSAIIISSLSNKEIKAELEDSFTSFFEYVSLDYIDKLEDAIEIVLNSFVEKDIFKEICTFDCVLFDTCDIEINL